MWDDAKPDERASPSRSTVIALACARVGGRGAGSCASRCSHPRGRRHHAARARQCRAPRGVIRGELSGTFFTMDLDACARRRSRTCRGCARSRCAGNGRIGWRSRSTSTQPLARWNDNGLVDTDGDVFVAELRRRPAAVRRSRGRRR